MTPRRNWNVPLIFAASGASYWLLEWGYRHLIAISPAVSPIVTKFPPEAMYVVLLVWFLLIAVPPCLGAFAIAFLLQRGRSSIALGIAIALTVIPVILIESWNQFALRGYDDVWRISILNTLRFAFLLEFILAFVAGLMVGPRLSSRAPAELKSVG